MLVDGAREGGDAVDEAADRVLARAEKADVAQRHPQHRHLQPCDLASHLRRHLGVGKHLIEQRRDDVDHDLVDGGATTGPHQLISVGPDQVGGHQRACEVTLGEAVCLHRVDQPHGCGVCSWGHQRFAHPGGGHGLGGQLSQQLLEIGAGGLGSCLAERALAALHRHERALQPHR